MNLGAFFDKFELFADAPDAVAKMRELVLELAMRGMLGTQDSRDTPASALVEDIVTERKRLKIRGARDDNGFLASSVTGPFDIPSTWAWVNATFPALIMSDNGRKVKTTEIIDAGSYPVVDQGKVFIRGYCDDESKVIRVTDPIIVFGDHTRETKFVDFDFVVGADGVKLLLPICVNPRFYFMAIRWLPLASRGYARHFRLLKAARVPLPPHAEQKRIVAKVDELMALCDRLEAQQRERETRHAALARASLARFAEAPTPANLEFLFHNAYAVPPADLRKSILTLAVQGKLVPQYPSDEPASQLLLRVARERPKIAEAQCVRLPKSVPTLAQGDGPYTLPDSWEWSRIGQLAVLIDYGTSHRAGSNASEIPVYRMGNIVGGRVVDENMKYVSRKLDDLPRLYLKQSDILFNRTNSYELVGKTGMYRGDDDVATFASYLIRVRTPGSLILAPFVSLAMNAPFFRQTQIEPEIVQQCGQANFNGTKLASSSLPIPPLAEQHRIVAKVDELMALVDKLEAELASARTTASNLLAAAVAELTQGKPSHAAVQH